MSCHSCGKPNGENSQSYMTLCKPCYITKKRKETHKKCKECHEYCIKKDSSYEVCYVCNHASYLLKKHTALQNNNPLSDYAFSK